MGNGSHRATCGVWEWWPGSFTRASRLPPRETISSRTGCVTNSHSRSSESEGAQMGFCVTPCTLQAVVERIRSMDWTQFPDALQGVTSLHHPKSIACTATRK
jgi:hypothetical protein